MSGFATLFVAVPASAEEAPPVDDTPTDEIIVYGRAIEQIGVAMSGSQGVVGYADFENRPISRAGELAENVPGLVATQHSGEGKANQYFLRGFNLDHGTDLAGFVDGAPINMRSHGHGQGYLDLNFLIPELVERIDYTKGPYYSAQGDFASAGSIAFTMKDTLRRPVAEFTSGSFGYYRAFAAGSADVGGGTFLTALEGTLDNGPWILDQNLRKGNALIKYATPDWSLMVSGYAARWTSTDQVPERAIASGLIPRLGFIDPDLGGKSGRIAATFNAHSGDTRFTAYAIGSRLRLTSNFTYFLDDPVNGDEFRQIDRRGVFGGSIRHETEAGGIKLRFGAETRWDRIGQVGLYRTVAGTPVATVRQDRVDEYSGALYGEGELALTDRLRLVVGVRGDALGYRVRSDLAANSGKGSDAILTPKAALAWRAAPGLELYANYGEGYHSNDVRGATISVDPASGDPVDRVPVYARSRGAELGVRLEHGQLTASLVGFYLGLNSELVFVGDAGATEPNDATRRFGGELALFWRPSRWLTLDGTVAYTHARFTGVPVGLNRIPNAVPTIFGGGISADLGNGLTMTARLRHFGRASLIEDGSQESKPTSLINLGGYWQRGSVRFGVDVLNLLDAQDLDISYFYASRLPGEPVGGVEDRHIHPVEPRQVRVFARIAF